MARLMDSTVGYLFQFLFGDGLSNLIPAWQALNLNSWMIGAIALIIIVIPCAAVYFYRLSDRRIHLSYSFCLSGIVFGILAELFLPPLPNKQHILPWGGTLIQNSNPTLSLSFPLKPARNEKESLEILSRLNLNAPKLPNIYLFIVETFRRDFITPETAPTLSAFAVSHLYPITTHANADSTFPSWFSILHSNFPHHWADMRDTWEQGSTPLKILKNLGYELFIYSSADLSYFHMDELLFGKKRKLADFIFEAKEGDVWAKDASCIDLFERNLSKNGRCTIFFLDSTHSEYSIPPDFPLYFQPVPDQINYLMLTPEQIGPIQNRYRNAIRYMDSLFSRVVNTLKENQLLDDAIIVVTGDHGEEFFEDGALFHGTHLNEAQTSVPIIYKLPHTFEKPPAQNSTHLDILPTILHSVTGTDHFAELFDGESLFKEKRRPYRLAIHHNCAAPPSEFLIQNEQFTYRFKRINATTLEIISNPPIDEHAIKDLLQTSFSSKEASHQ